MKLKKKNEKGQVLVIVGAAMLVLLIFIGLAIDGTELYLNYTRLKRAVDAAAVAAANDFKRGNTATQMLESSLEILKLHEVDPSTVNLKVFICDANGDGTRDASLQTAAPEFYNACPNTPTELPRKLVYVQATQISPTYFVTLIGIRNVPIQTSSIGEAAPVDLVIVMDTSSSMGNVNVNLSNNFDPTACNLANNCDPFYHAKDAAKALIDTMYQGYDRVAVVSFNSNAITNIALTDNLAAAKTAIDGMHLHHDAPVDSLWNGWKANASYNPVNPEDRNGDGSDDDTGTLATQCANPVPANRLDGSKPCDAPTATGNPDVLDAFDWDQNGTFSTGGTLTCNSTTNICTCSTTPASDECTTKKWLAENDPFGVNHNPHPPLSLVSTCSGCGIREGNNNLVNNGRPNAVWVMVFLSDGIANMSDTPQTFPYDAAKDIGIKSNIFPNGFCGGYIDVNKTGVPTNFWRTLCIEKPYTTRYCINGTDNTTCPPGSTWTQASPPYGVEDYARDMTDRAALRFSTNALEKRGNDMAIYTIGFGSAVSPDGEPLLRYMAAVGDDGNRTTDPCSAALPKTSCGQYYYAATSDDLLPIFENIASRIYTKLSR